MVSARAHYTRSSFPTLLSSTLRRKTIHHIEQTYRINAPVSKVWQALTDADAAEQWGAGPAKVDARVGGEFSYWDGHIHGTFTKLVPEQQIEQDWYGHDNPTWKYHVVFIFEGDDKTTTVHMTYSGNILDEQKDIADWQDYYFTRLKIY